MLANKLILISVPFTLTAASHTIVNAILVAKWPSLRKHTYSNTLKTLPTKKKNENFQMKNSDTFQISAQNVDCGYL